MIYLNLGAVLHFGWPIVTGEEGEKERKEKEEQWFVGQVVLQWPPVSTRGIQPVGIAAMALSFTRHMADS